MTRHHGNHKVTHLNNDRLEKLTLGGQPEYFKLTCERVNSILVKWCLQKSLIQIKKYNIYIYFNSICNFVPDITRLRQRQSQSSYVRTSRAATQRIPLFAKVKGVWRLQKKGLLGGGGGRGAAAHLSWGSRA